ncbi:hypothetical protein MRB53_029308 [Persea americana]|uniref:Uncharacterized protein n=1 Tax=Persea americana TaxID=3435 RepID=A0ACC2KI05_PERAE|nr:hypothetical protein MRB53_029308 [Persea americana]
MFPDFETDSPSRLQPHPLPLLGEEATRLNTTKADPTCSDVIERGRNLCSCSCGLTHLPLSATNTDPKYHTLAANVKPLPKANQTVGKTETKTAILEAENPETAELDIS